MSSNARGSRALRTPEDRFAGLPDYPFAAHYATVDGLRMHYVDEGPASAPVILMLHGEPSWSYLYRHMIPPCAAAGYRVIAPDLVGFGKSDKPAAVADHSYRRHVDWTRGLLDAIGLERLSLVCQDWGSLIGLRLLAEQPERFERAFCGNGFLPTGDEDMGRAFRLWRLFARHSPWFPSGRIVDYGCFRSLSTDERAAYDAPFPSRRYLAGPRAMPRLVPVQPDNPASAANRRAWEVLAQWHKPFHLCFSNGDPITRGADQVLKARIPGADAASVRLRGGHFLQEDAASQWADFIIQQMPPQPR